MHEMKYIWYDFCGKLDLELWEYCATVCAGVGFFLIISY